MSVPLYYAYSSFGSRTEKMSANSGRKWKHESKKVNRLLFRLVNYIQPDTIVDAGTLSASSLYLQAGHTKADYVGASDLSELFLEKDTPVDFCICTIIGMREFVEQVFDLCASRTTGRGLFVIEGIRYTKKMKALWKRYSRTTGQALHSICMIWELSFRPYQDKTALSRQLLNPLMC